MVLSDSNSSAFDNVMNGVTITHERKMEGKCLFSRDFTGVTILVRKTCIIESTVDKYENKKATLKFYLSLEVTNL